MLQYIRTTWYILLTSNTEVSINKMEKKDCVLPLMYMLKEKKKE